MLSNIRECVVDRHSRVCVAVLVGLLLGGCANRSKPHPPKRPPTQKVKRHQFPSPRPMWTFSVDGGAFDGTPLIDDRVVYVADLDGDVYALELDSGVKKWKYASQSFFQTSPVIKGQRLFIGDLDGKVHCIDKESGEQLWTFVTGGAISADVALHRNRVLVSSHDAALYCLDGKTRSVVWRFEAVDESHAPATVIDGFALVIASCSSVLHAVNVNNGRHFQDFQLPGETVAGMSIQDTHVFTATMRGDAVCLDWKEGVEVWKKQLNDRVSAQVRGAPAMIGDKIVFGSEDQHVRALDSKTGRIVWEFGAKGAIESSVAVHDDRVFFTTSRGRVYALESRTGKAVWQQDIGGFGATGGPALTDDWIVVANSRGTVRTFRR